MTHFSVETMTREELHLAVEWAAREGWNPGLHDAATFYKADPEGFFVGKLDGETVAIVSGVSYGADFGFLGFYIVSREHRDKGYGGRVAIAAQQHLAGCRCIGWDGVEEQQKNYARHGGQYAYPNVRYESRGIGPPVPPATEIELLSLGSFPLEEILRYDRRHFPAERGEFLKAWISQPESLAIGLRKGGRLCGYGVRRRCRSGHKIAPLFADDPEGAALLLSALRDGLAPDEPFYLDVPENNPSARNLAASVGMIPVFSTTRMYFGEFPSLPSGEIYGITSFELG